MSARTEFNKLDKAKLRSAMYAEQRSLCVYCERRLSEHNTPPVEHWYPISKARDFAIHWANLYLSCPSVDTCDAVKRNRWLGDSGPDLPWPTEVDYERLVCFNGLGEIHVRKNPPTNDVIRYALRLAIEGDGNREAILNLNHPTLRAARREVLEQERTRLKRDFEGRTASKEDREDRAAKILDQDPRPAFVSIRVAWLRKELR